MEWSALSGDEVEAVLANLLYNDNPRALRIRPSTGDYGIDILVPSDSSTNVRHVFQIKKFALNLTAGQKTQIQNSLKRVLVGLTRKNIPLGDWFLIMPLNPTLENLQWFQKMPDDAITELFSDTDVALTQDEQHTITAWRESPGRIIDWKGLDYCEALASKYWFVPDYYLHGGSERIKAAVSDVAKLLHLDLQTRTPANSTSILTPAEIREHLQRLQRTLDGDPHFRYGIALEPHPTQLLHMPGLIAATQETAADGSTITFKIYERHAEALEQRPIPITLRIQFQEGSDEELAFHDWQKYGKPLQTSGATIQADLPGGLGRTLSGNVKISQATPEVFDVRYRIVTPDGAVLAEIPLSVSLTTGVDNDGAWSRGTDPSGFLTLETHADTADRTIRMSVSLADLDGQDPSAVLPALEFAASFARPNILEVAAKYGPFHRASQIPGAEALYPGFVLNYIRALTVIQTRTPIPLTVPDLDTVKESDVKASIRAANLIQGKTLVGTWKEINFEPDPENVFEFTEQGHYQLAVTRPLAVTVGTQAIDLGGVEMTLLSAKAETGNSGAIVARPNLNNTVHETFAPDQTASGSRIPVRARPAPPEM